jgi:hypothetical protein
MRFGWRGSRGSALNLCGKRHNLSLSDKDLPLFTEGRLRLLIDD